jgi:hypothetical protein
VILPGRLDGALTRGSPALSERTPAPFASECSEQKARRGLELWTDVLTRDPQKALTPILAELLDRGTPIVPPNSKEAFKWAKLSADAGSAEGMSTLADIYLQGKAVPRNFEFAADLWEKAARLGSVPAQLNMAKILDEGFSAKRKSNKQQAYVWALIATANVSNRRAFELLMDPEKLNRTMHKEIESVRSKLERELSSSERQKAEAIASQWKSNPSVF